MKLPRILIIDDQYTHDEAERGLLKRKAGLIEIPSNARDEEISMLANDGTVAAAVFCSGQSENGKNRNNDYEVIRKTVEKGWGDKAEFQWNLVLLDVRFDSNPIKYEDDKFGEIVCQKLINDFPNLPVVMLSSKGQKDLGDQDVDYLSKGGLEGRQLKECLLNQGLLDETQARRLLQLGDDVVVASTEMIHVYSEALKYAVTDEAILILGDSGVGKENVARYIHSMSPRCNGPFITVNMAAIPESLLESELFGVIRNYPGFHNKEAEKVGLFELANNGTLFLDEIGDMSLPSQAKILRALQDKVICRIGGIDPIRLNIRVLTATARNLSQKIKDGLFLSDLKHRIGTLEIVIPPLQNRSADILPLVDYFLTKCTMEQSKNGISLSGDARKVLKACRFADNNVRELENLIKRLVAIKGHNGVISDKDVLAAMGRTDTGIWPKEPSTQALSDKVKASKSTVTLQNLADILDTLPVDKDDHALKGAKPRLEKAFQCLMRHLAGAALDRCRDPLTKQLNRQSAMRLLTGDENLKGKGPERMLNEILGRKQATPIQEEDLRILIETWEKHARSKS